MGESLDVQIVRDQVVDRRDFTCGEFGVDFLIALATGNVLAPRFSRQGILRWGRLVPAIALGDIVQASGDLFRQVAFFGEFCVVVHVVSDAVAHRFVEIPIRGVRQQPPHPALWRERDGACLFRSVEQKWDDGVAADVAGDVFLRIVRPHLFLVDVLLENVAEHVRVDLVVVAERAVVEMPVVRVEKRENLFKRLVGNVNLRVVLLQIMHLEQTAVEIRDFAEQGRQLGRAVSFGLPQALVKQPQQEQPVETEKVALALLLAHPVQPVAQIIRISVEKTPLLDEVKNPALKHRGFRCKVGAGCAINRQSRSSRNLSYSSFCKGCLPNLVDIQRGIVVSVTRPTAFAGEHTITQRQVLFDRTASVTHL